VSWNAEYITYIYMRKACVLMTSVGRGGSQQRLIRVRGASRTHILVLLYTFNIYIPVRTFPRLVYIFYIIYEYTSHMYVCVCLCCILYLLQQGYKGWMGGWARECVDAGNKIDGC